MKTFREELTYLYEIATEADHGLDAIARIEEAAQRWLEVTAEEWGARHPQDRHNDQMRLQAEIFDRIQSLLTSWGRVSLLLLPERRGSAERGRYLQELLEVSADHHLIFNRDLRNNWMHFDERLDKAIEAFGSVGLQYFGRSTDQVSGIRMRLFRADTLEVEFLGDRFPIKEMKGALVDIARRVNKAKDSASDRWKHEFL